MIYIICYLSLKSTHNVLVYYCTCRSPRALAAKNTVPWGCQATDTGTYYINVRSESYTAITIYRYQYLARLNELVYPSEWNSSLITCKIMICVKKIQSILCICIVDFIYVPWDILVWSRQTSNRWKCWNY